MEQAIVFPLDRSAPMPAEMLRVLLLFRAAGHGLEYSCFNPVVEEPVTTATSQNLRQALSTRIRCSEPGLSLVVRRRFGDLRVRIL